MNTNGRVKKNLCREGPDEPPLVVPWDKGAIKKFKFDTEDIELLENGEALWRGDTAFNLENLED